MKPENTIIKDAEFNPKIKQYILYSVAFFLTISLMGIPLLIIWFLGLGQYIGKRYYEHLFCTLTSNHLRFKKGVFFKVEKTIPLENIQDLTFKENPILNYLDLKILKIETAGSSNPYGSDMTLIGIKEAGKFRDLVLEQRQAIKDNKGSELGLENSEQQHISQLLVEIRDILKQFKEDNSKGQ